eukprot:TRINITY_DN1044_c0_g2_i1.p1 TRINITY_DN1044_c0_g2~~TRINITY_DN1044_c0_g2_i1.p1  ORF type:complete len:857 (+),score=97.29 TRINITY_DN1044_c0_g2_i1:113-2683(+)
MATGSMVDQEFLLDDIQTRAAQAAALMKKGIESGNLREGIQYADTMLSELRNPFIAPKYYYILFMQIFNDLKELEDHFFERKKAGRKMADLYETVQQASGILQRLYLMATVACVYIDTQEAPAKEVLKDLIEMAKGIQNPVRGLFFRYYLLKKFKDRLPDKGSKFEGEGGDVNDCTSFLIQNLTEMNRLWIRMQHSGSKDKSRREADRHDVNMVVGENITRLSDLKGVDLDLYKDVVQPKLFEIIQNCKDPISQQYLMDCIIQVFTNEFHLKTLEKLLEACTSLHSAVDIKTIFISLMDRLSHYAATQPEDIQEVDKEINIFALFKKYIDKVLEEQGVAMELKKLIELQVAFLRFSIKTYPGNMEYVNQILEICVKILQLQPAKSITEDCLKNVVKLLIIPLDSLSIGIFGLSHFPTLMQYLTPAMLRMLSKKVIMAVVNARKPVETLDLVQRLITFLKHLLEGVDAEEEYRNDPYEFEETQTFTAKLVHLIECKDPLTQFQAITALKEAFDKGGIQCLRYTTPAIVGATYNLIHKMPQRKQSTASATEEEKELSESERVTPSGPIEGTAKLPILKVFQFVYQAIDTIGQAYPDSAIRLFLQGVLAMNDVVAPGSETEELGYQFASQALVLYQDELTDTDSKFRAITLIIGTLQKATFFSPDNFETLTTNTTQYCAKLLKKQDQCKALLMCTHMFCSELAVLFFIVYKAKQKEPERVEKHLKKTLSLCEACKTVNIPTLDLYVRILNKYIYYYENLGTVLSVYKQCLHQIKPEQIQELMEKIRKEVKDSDEVKSKDARRFFELTEMAIKIKATTKEKYKAFAQRSYFATLLLLRGIFLMKSQYWLISQINPRIRMC